MQTMVQPGVAQNGAAEAATTAQGQAGVVRAAETLATSLLLHQATQADLDPHLLMEPHSRVLSSAGGLNSSHPGSKQQAQVTFPNTCSHTHANITIMQHQHIMATSTGSISHTQHSSVHHHPPSLKRSVESCSRHWVCTP